MTERATRLVLDSMKTFAEGLAVVAFRSGHETGDVGHYEAEDLDMDSLWIDYWEEIYRPTFLGASFALSDPLRADLRVRRLPDNGATWFLDAIEKLEKKHFWTTSSDHRSGSGSPLRARLRHAPKSSKSRTACQGPRVSRTRRVRSWPSVRSDLRACRGAGFNVGQIFAPSLS